MNRSGNEVRAEKHVKVKSMRRTIALLQVVARSEFGVSVMDVSRATCIPQSTTSEMLEALMETGILTRDCEARRYRGMPLLEAMGLSSQPVAVASGHLFRAMDDLARRSGLIDGLFGINDTKLQVYQITGPSGSTCVTGMSAEQRAMSAQILRSAAPIQLSESIIGHVLLSGLGKERASRLLWRMRADSDRPGNFDYASIYHNLSGALENDVCTGLSGFDENWDAMAILLPSDKTWQPAALAVIYPRSISSNCVELIRNLLKIRSIG